MASLLRAARRSVAAGVGLGLSLYGCTSERVGSEPAAGGGGGAAGLPAAGGSDAPGGGGSRASGGLFSTGGTPNEAGGTASSGGAAIGAGTNQGGGTASGGASSGAAGEAGGGGLPGGEPDCVAQAGGLPVYAAWDPLGYAPYSLLGCQLAYVTPEGELRLRNLSTREEQALEDGSFAPRRPTISAQFVAWETTLNGKSSVRVFRAGRTTTLTGAFDHAGEPRAAADALVFTAWAEASPNSDTDVLLYEPATDSLSTALGGAGQQRFADVSAEYVAASDFSEDPRGYFVETGSDADVVVFERKSGMVTRRARPGKQAFPMLGSDGVLAYLDWGAVHPEPKFSAFSLRLGRVSGAPETDSLVRAVRTEPSYVRPSLRGNVIDFIDAPGGPPVLYRVDVTAPSELAATELDVTAPLGPIAAPGVTLLGARLADGVELRVVTRAATSLRD